ncbi:MAG TPA: MBL fold metallo-hydrolase [Anaerolineales bacterium]|nr:MBL fold metallo-hydrolase [Anaerolineales bacterium]
MRIEFQGAAHTVTGSLHILRVNGTTLLLDCGLYQGRRAEAAERNAHLPLPAREVGAVVLSHAHLDHCGNLPSLVKQGFSGRIYATQATAHVTELVLRDSGRIHEYDAQFVSKRNAEKGLPPVEPLYTEADAEAVLPLLTPRAYDEPFLVAPGVMATFFDAGHILGSAGMLLEIEEHGRTWRLVFSGDIGRRHLPILRDPALPPSADFLIMESTYGDRPHRDLFQAYLELRDAILRTYRRGGKVVIPSFAIGRTQELVYDLRNMIVQGEIPKLPIIVDSPLATGVSEVYRAHTECYDDDAKQLLARGDADEALGFNLVTFTRSVEESKALNDRRDPMIILSASGMAEGGRIVHHLRNTIGDSRNTVLIVSWQAPYTLGRRLAEKAETVRIFGEEHARRAEVVTIGGFSAHAGQNFLREYARQGGASARSVFLVHGEEKSAAALMEALTADGLHAPVSFPDRGTVFDTADLA